MTEPLYTVAESWAKHAHVDNGKYLEIAQSVRDPDGFWVEHGRRIDWIKPYTRVKRTSSEPGKVAIKWFDDVHHKRFDELH